MVYTQGIVAASSKLMLSGILTHSAEVVLRTVEYESPPMTATRSPTWKEASGPTPVMMPEHSQPRPFPSSMLPSTTPIEMRISYPS